MEEVRNGDETGTGAGRMEVGRRFVSRDYWLEVRWHAEMTFIQRERDWHWIRRRIWRANHGPSLVWNDPIISTLNFFNWFFNAHDCQSPVIGCSCAGGYRFPAR